MNNFKSGSGNLDFGTGSEDGDEQKPTDIPEDSEQRAAGESSDQTPATDENSSTDPVTADDSDRGTKQGSNDAAAYPYFVRRSNVGDERDTRLEIHVRDSVAEQEGSFRSELADALDVSEVSKTDAREFALLAAYEHPEKVAELMEEQGFGVI